jgi:hypothetical protein
VIPAERVACDYSGKSLPMNKLNFQVREANVGIPLYSMYVVTCLEYTSELCRMIPLHSLGSRLRRSLRTFVMNQFPDNNRFRSTAMATLQDLVQYPQSSSIAVTTQSHHLSFSKNHCILPIRRIRAFHRKRQMYLFILFPCMKGMLFISFLFFH